MLLAMYDHVCQIEVIKMGGTCNMLWKVRNEYKIVVYLTHYTDRVCMPASGLLLSRNEQKDGRK
jgi:hypothetical protein